MNVIKLKCCRCKVSLPEGSFTKKRSGKFKKTCEQCLIKRRSYSNKYRCEHKKNKWQCSKCKGVSYCSHGKIRSVCKSCEGGSICVHRRVGSKCGLCNPTPGCTHDVKTCCKICNPVEYQVQYLRSDINSAIYNDKNFQSQKYIGCDMWKFKNHIESQFKIGMTWENRGDWHIDHKVPIWYTQDGITPSDSEIYRRLHYTNTQPLWAVDNLVKGSRYIGHPDDTVAVPQVILDMMDAYV